MSEILSNIVVEQSNINFSPDNNNLNITPEAIQLNIFTGASPGAGQSNNGELLYNNVNLVDGVPFTSYANGNLTLGNVANIKITGGVNSYYLQTDGTGNLSWVPGTANITGNGTPGGANTQIQYNDGGANFGGSAGFTFDKSSNVVSMPGNLGANGTITAVAFTANTGVFTGNGSGLSSLTASNITGQVANALVAGTVYTAAQPNITSVGTLTNLDVTGNTTSGNIYANTGTIIANLLTGTLTTAAQPNITSVGNLNGLNVTGNGIVSTQIRTTSTKVALGLDSGLTGQGNNAVGVGAATGYFNQGANTVAIGFQAGYDTQGANSIAIGTFAGNFFQHSNTIVLNATGTALNTSNANGIYIKPIRSGSTGNVLYYDDSTGEIVFGVVVANTANTAITVTGNSQPNITSVGTLTGLLVNGNITAANISANTGTFTGNGSGLTNINGANVTGTVPSANTAITVTGNSQPNITSVGNLTTLRISNTMIHLGANAGLANQSTVNSIAIGTNAGNSFLKDNAIAIGSAAGQGQNVSSTGSNAISIGRNSGYAAGADAIAIGNDAGNTSNSSISIGLGAGNAAFVSSMNLGENAGFAAGSYSINMGYGAGGVSGNSSISIGPDAQATSIKAISIGGNSATAANYAITIGANSNVVGPFNEKAISIGSFTTATGNGIAIGANSNLTGNNTILINATNSNVTANTANAFYVKPIRNALNANVVMYDQSTGEVTYNTLTNYTGYVSTISTTVNALVAANSVNSGTRAYVTDGNTTTFYSVIGGGGSNGVPVFSDGTDWRVG